jgi:hypothetical protein
MSFDGTTILWKENRVSSLEGKKRREGVKFKEKKRQKCVCVLADNRKGNQVSSSSR